MELLFKNKNLNLDSPAVMGILNVTPDSFFDGGKYTADKAILEQTERMIREGADIIDMGACSTRPNAKEVSESEELHRLIASVQLVRKQFPKAIISADTFRSKVAEEAVNAGADMINDVSGGADRRMFSLVAKINAPYVLMHLQGTPFTMPANPQYKDVVKEVKEYLSLKIEKLKSLKAGQIIIDPGFGFGKTLEHNYSLLKHLAAFKDLGFPILAGMSRKSMINKVLDTTPGTALNGTTSANTIALMNGASILRVHDVKEAKEAVKIFTFTRNSK